MAKLYIINVRKILEVDNKLDKKIVVFFAKVTSP